MPSLWAPFESKYSSYIIIAQYCHLVKLVMKCARCGITLTVPYYHYGLLMKRCISGMLISYIAMIWNAMKLLIKCFKLKLCIAYSKVDGGHHLGVSKREQQLSIYYKYLLRAISPFLNKVGVHPDTFSLIWVLCYQICNWPICCIKQGSTVQILTASLRHPRYIRMWRPASPSVTQSFFMLFQHGYRQQSNNLVDDCNNFLTTWWRFGAIAGTTYDCVRGRCWCIPSSMGIA